MKNFFIRSCIFVCTILSLQGQVLNKQENQQLVTNYEKNASEYLKENIYIQTDKDVYEIGDDLWFKAYMLSAYDLIPNVDTQIIFVELRNEKENSSNIILQEKFEAQYGTANGHFSLVDTLSVGTYSLRMYSKKTLESKSKTLKAVKRFQVQESILPKIITNTNFSKTAYAFQDEIDLNVIAYSRGGVPLENAAVYGYLYKDEEKLGTVKAKTDVEGKVKLTFPVKKSSKANTIRLKTEYNKNSSSIDMKIPFQKNQDIQFGMYPEGGNLVSDLENTIAFKAIDIHGSPVKTKGMLYENDVPILPFATVHEGMGRFSFIPKKDHSYHVKLSEPNIDSIYKLPEIKPQGITLKLVKTTTEHLQFKISKSPSVKFEKVYLRAQSHGRVYYMAIASLKNQQTYFKIPLEKLPQGIMEVTVLNEQYVPLTERLVYANLDKKIHISLKEFNKETYAQKEKITLNFEVTDQNKKPIIANLGISVYDHLYGQKENSTSIFTHYYLFSELKGRIHNPTYYFDAKNKHRSAYLDLLLLTQGWRAYEWNYGNLQSVPAKTATFNEYTNGKAYVETSDGKLKHANAAEIQIITPKMVEVINTDFKGAFSLSHDYLKIAEGDQLLFNVASDSIIFELNDPFKKIQKITHQKEVVFPQQLKETFIAENFLFNDVFDSDNYLEEVTLIGYKKRQQERHIQRIITGRRFMPSGVIPYAGKEGDYICYEAEILNCKNHDAGPPPEDGRRYRLNNGELVIYQAPESMKKKEKVKNRVSTKGFYPIKKFYMPTYDLAEERSFPDNRKTLVWEPNLISNKKGECSVTFYTSDVQSIFIGRIEGVSYQGLLGSSSFKFKVK